MHPEARLARIMVASLVAGGLACGPAPDAGVADLQQVLAERTEGQSIYRHDDVKRQEVLQGTLLALLRTPMTEPSAVKVALLNNPRLQAELARLGIATADLHQAGLADNPRLWATVRFPAQGAVSIDAMGGLTQSFLSLFTIAARQRVAEARLEAETLAVSHVVLDTVAQVRAGYTEIQRHQQVLAALRAVAAVWPSEADVPEDDREAVRALRDDLSLRELSAEGALVAARERLNRLLGLWAPAQLRWTIAAPLPSLPRLEIPVDELERLAVTQRLDLLAVRARTRMYGRTLQLVKDWGWLSSLSLGATFNRPTGPSGSGDGWTVGPAAELSLPIFDQGQAAVARLQALHRKSQHETTALAVAIRSEVREQRAALERARRRVALVRDGGLRRSEAAAAEPHARPSDHLRAQIELFEAYARYLDATSAYWRARHAVTRACGGVTPAPR